MKAAETAELAGAAAVTPKVAAGVSTTRGAVIGAYGIELREAIEPMEKEEEEEDADDELAA